MPIQIIDARYAAEWWHLRYFFKRLEQIEAEGRLYPPGQYSPLPENYLEDRRDELAARK